MFLLNADFSLLIAIPYGLIIAAFVIIIEIYLLKKILELKSDSRIYFAVILSNLLSFLIGRVLFDSAISNSMHLIMLLIVCAIISIIIETFSNYLFLSKCGFKKVLMGTTLANIISNVFAGIFIYLFTKEFPHVHF